MEYISVSSASEKWHVSNRQVQKLCFSGRIEGVKKIGRTWLIPYNAKKPSDMRSAYGINMMDERDNAIFQLQNERIRNEAYLKALSEDLINTIEVNLENDSIVDYLSKELNDPFNGIVKKYLKQENGYSSFIREVSQFEDSSEESKGTILSKQEYDHAYRHGKSKYVSDYWLRVPGYVDCYVRTMMLLSRENSNYHLHALILNYDKTRQKLAELRSEEIKKHKDMLISLLSQEYYAAFYVDAAIDRFEILRLNQDKLVLKIKNLLYDSKSYLATLRSFVRNFVCPEDRNLFSFLYDVNNEVWVTKTIKFRAASINDGDYIFKAHVVKKELDADSKQFTIGFMLENY